MRSVQYSISRRLFTELASQYRSKNPGPPGGGAKRYMILASEIQRDANLDGADKFVSSTGRLSTSANDIIFDHVVGGNIILPGVEYIEMAFAHCKTK